MDHGMASPPLDVHRREATPMVSPRPEGSHAPWRPTAAKSVDAWPGRCRAATPQRRRLDRPRDGPAQAPNGPYTYPYGQVRPSRARITLSMSGGTVSGGDGDGTPCFRPKPGRSSLGLPFDHASILGVCRRHVDARTRPPRLQSRSSVACLLGKRWWAHQDSNLGPAD